MSIAILSCCAQIPTLTSTSVRILRYAVDMKSCSGTCPLRRGQPSRSSLLISKKMTELILVYSHSDACYACCVQLNVGAQQKVSGLDQWAELEQEEEEQEMIEESSEGELSDSEEVEDSD